MAENDSTPQDPPANDGQAPSGGDQKPVATPPWGDDFDPARAWQTIQNLRAREKELTPLAEKARQLEESQRTETERLTERLTKAEQRALDAARYEVALEKGLTRAQAKRLVGSTPQELEADADELLSTFGSSGPRRPVGDADQGPRDTPPAPTDPKSLADAVIAQRGY
jgi:hypothetical protein